MAGSWGVSPDLVDTPSMRTQLSLPVQFGGLGIGDNVVIADASHIGAAALVVGQAVTFLRAQHATLSDAGAFLSEPGDSNHAAHEWAAHGLSDVCHDVKSALGVGVQILTDPSVLVSLPKGSDGRPGDVGLFGNGAGIRGNTVTIYTTIAPILGVSSSDPTTASRAAERHKIQKYDEGARNAAGMLRFVPFAVSEFGSLAAPHVEAFLVELAKASHTYTGQKIGQLLSAWRRRFSLLIIMAHANNVLGGVAAARARGT
eukprot:jgi/Tetstr1/448353/TSEL_035636.t1